MKVPHSGGRIATMTREVSYYGGRILDHLEQFGLPLRKRSLLFYDRDTNPDPAPPFDYGGSGIIGPVTREQFQQLRWLADPVITKEAASWEGRGHRWAIAATRRDTLDAFCWIEEGTAEIRFFDVPCPLPPGMTYLSRVWVHPAWRGHGVGKELLRYATAYSATLGAARLVSACVPHNRPMRHLFAELGWTYRQRVDYLRAGPVSCFCFRPDQGSTERLLSMHAAGQRMFGSIPSKVNQR